MTTIAVPPRRARTRARTTATRAPARRRVAPRAAAKAATKPLAIGRVGGLLALVTIFALVSAVVFHVVLAQNQMELDRLNGQIAKAQRTYEQRRLATNLLASPQRVIQEAQRLGLVVPPEPAQYLYVPNAPMPKSDDGSTADTMADWSKTKSSLGTTQP